MGVIEDLKDEGQASQQTQHAKQAATEMRRESHMRAIGPKMQALYDFFNELVNTLHTSNPDIEVAYDVPGFGVLENLNQGEYEIDGAVPSKRFGLYFKCVVPDIARVPKLKKEAHSRDKPSWVGDFIRFRSKPFSTEENAMTVEAFVAVSLKFKADADDNLIRLAVKNLDYIGNSTYSFAPEGINVDLMEELAKCALRRPNRFHELSGDRITTEFRLRLKHDVEEQQREHAQVIQQEAGILKKALGLFRGGA